MQQQLNLAYVDIVGKASTIKTFDGHIWKVKGLVGINDQTGNRKHLAELYYNISLIKDQHSKTIAMRKRFSLPLKQLRK